MPEIVITTTSTNTTSFFNNENNVHLSKTNDVMKQSTTPLRNRKPLQSLVNTPSHAILSSEKASWVDSSEMDLKRGLSSSVIKSWPAVSSVPLEVLQQTHNVDSHTQILLNEQNRFFNATSMTLNTSIEVPSNEESFDQGLMMNDNTVFRDLYFAQQENSTPYLSCNGGFSNRLDGSFEEDDDMLQLRLANPICEESYESSFTSDHL